MNWFAFCCSKNTSSFRVALVSDICGNNMNDCSTLVEFSHYSQWTTKRSSYSDNADADDLVVEVGAGFSQIYKAVDFDIVM